MIKLSEESSEEEASQCRSQESQDGAQCPQVSQSDEEEESQGFQVSQYSSEDDSASRMYSLLSES